MSKSELVTLNIVFEPIADSPDLVFVEIETEDGKGVVAGEWVEHPSNGLFQVLRLRVAAEDIHAINE